VSDSGYSSLSRFEPDCLSPSHCYCLLRLLRLLHPTHHHQMLRCYSIPPLTVMPLLQNLSLQPMQQYSHHHLLETSPNCRRRRRHQQDQQDQHHYRVYPRYLPTQAD
jgi:hypothetical protein